MYRVTMKNIKSGRVVRREIAKYRETENFISLIFPDGKTKRYQKNEWYIAYIHNYLG